ncbi:MAG: sulfate ABC transporter permease [Cellulosimicrobium funkei]|uniref:Sulfate ABC transporter permease subunit n=1 Tax=Cellulosimicrobium cellulans TaxID=1710 RepID=A0ABX5X8Y8_CELCE|nr:MULTISPECIES: sulfate ABC transporter permease subunit [Cellulosimicrobium]QDP74682.1 sulfate ABC transporter permease subunit [Cellulosimicrobium cellulans]
MDSSPWVRRTLRAVVVVYLVLLVGWPVSLVVRGAFADGLETFQRALADPSVVFALQLTAAVAVQVVLINTVFGVGISMLIVRYDFPGKALLNALLDLPLSVSPIVVGLSLVLVYGKNGWFGGALEDAGLQVIFAPSGIVLATAFVCLPLVIREVVPVLTELGTDEELAATSLGASRLQTFRRITLPAIRWAVVYGVVLTLARALGEFGAVKVVSGNFEGRTQTSTLLVEQRYQDFEQGTAYAVAFLLASVSVACIVAVTFLRSDDAAGPRPRRSPRTVRSTRTAAPTEADA